MPSSAAHLESHLLLKNWATRKSDGVIVTMTIQFEARNIDRGKNLWAASCKMIATTVFARCGIGVFRYIVAVSLTVLTSCGNYTNVKLEPTNGKLGKFSLVKRWIDRAGDLN